MTEPIPFQKIVVPLDGTPQAEAAIPHAEQIARGGGELMLVHIYHPSGTAYVSEAALAGNTTHIEEARQRALDYVKALRNRISSQHIKVSGHTIDGSEFAQLVCDFVNEEGADVVVMHAASQNRLVRVLMGDPASSVAGCVNACLLLVRGDQPEWDPKSKKVLAAREEAAAEAEANKTTRLLEQLESLHEAGILSDEEYAAKQAAVQQQS